MRDPDAGATSAREGILGRLRATLARRGGATDAPHPGPFLGPRPDGLAAPVEQFRTMFQLAGGEVVECRDEAAAREWVDTLEVTSICLGTDVPETWTGGRRLADPSNADAAISFARAGIGETGTLILDSGGGRRAQLLAPTHVVVVGATHIHPTFADALSHLQHDLPAALGLHSGPSKSADIGQVMVRGVHGPGRVIALVIGAGPPSVLSAVISKESVIEAETG